MKKVMAVFGTRPEAIKMCPVIKELKKHNELITKVCVTGQHREMLKQVLDVFNVEPDYNLDIMQESQTLFDITERVLAGIKDVMEQEKPDIVLVHGDTTTTFATSLACFYMKIPVGHVEAGLRTHDIYSPFPEEFNRTATGLITKLHFAPTRTAANNLISEGKDPKDVFITGNTVIDALKTTVRPEYRHPILDEIQDKRIVLITAHRRENRSCMKEIFEGIKQVLDEHDDVVAVYPVHLNPELKEAANEVFADTPNIKLIPPLDVVDFHNFMNRSYLILTDSGGIQEEAPSLGKPVLVMRNTTERPEGIEAGTLRLIGTSRESIYHDFTELLNDEEVYMKMSKAVNPYGDGFASRRIAECILNNSYCLEPLFGKTGG